MFMALLTNLILIGVILLAVYFFFKYFPDIFDGILNFLAQLLGFGKEVIGKGLDKADPLLKADLLAVFKSAEHTEKIEKESVAKLKDLSVKEKKWGALMKIDLQEYQAMSKLLADVLSIKMFKKEDRERFSPYVVKAYQDIKLILGDNKVELESIKVSINDFKSEMVELSERASQETVVSIRDDLKVLIGVENQKLGFWKKLIKNLEVYESNAIECVEGYQEIYGILKKYHPDSPPLKGLEKIKSIHDSLNGSLVKIYDLDEYLRLNQSLETISLQAQQLASKVENDVRSAA